MVVPAEKLVSLLDIEELTDLRREVEKLEHDQIEKHGEPAVLDVQAGNEFASFRDLARKLVNVPKKEIDEKRKDEG